jgi:photosystem II stability/assembly factor-like uncharacterized protein
LSGSRHRQRLEVFLAGIILLALAGSARAGVRDQDATLYRSAAVGLTWTALAGPGLARVALDPSHPSTVYAGGFQRLLRSLDGGGTWSDVSPSGLGEVTVLTVTFRGQPGTVYAAGSEGGLFVGRFE